MDAETKRQFAELQFVLARILWAPYCDRERAVALAELAAASHPDPEMRELIVQWLDVRATPPLEQMAVAHLRESFPSA